MGRLFLHYLESPSNKGVYVCKKCALHGETVHLARMDDILSKARVFMGPTSGRGVRAGRGARACMAALSTLRRLLTMSKTCHLHVAVVSFSEWTGVPFSPMCQCHNRPARGDKTRRECASPLSGAPCMIWACRADVGQKYSTL